MKLFYTTMLALLLYGTSNATIWQVSVSNVQFSPATVNALVGDVIQFNWVNGTHTATCGPGTRLSQTTLPASATPFDVAIDAGHTSFSYTLTVAGTYNYGCVPHFDLGMKGTITVSGPLAVKFGSFSVSNNKNSALLQWQTFSESNTDYFSLRKSTDAINFTEIGRISAAGNSALTKNYQFEDNDLGELYKYLYYEVVTVDKDKKEGFSPIKTLRNTNLVNDNLIVALSPNPITRPGQVQLKFNADKAGQMDVSIFNSSGQLVLKTTMTAFYGLNSGHLHVCDLEKGIYNIIFSLAGRKETRKVSVL